MTKNLRKEAYAKEAYDTLSRYASRLQSGWDIKHEVELEDFLEEVISKLQVIKMVLALDKIEGR